MAVIWYPGQDVDFLARLSRIEKALGKVRSESSPGDVVSDDDIRIRLDSLEEDMIRLNEVLERVESMLVSLSGCKSEQERDSVFPRFTPEPPPSQRETDVEQRPSMPVIEE